MNRYKRGDKVRLKKETTLVEQKDGLNDNYTLEGVLAEPIEMGKPIMVFRSNRNGINAIGFFTSSFVVEINKDKITTQNSVWQIQQIK